jgi:hypothetical protein
VVIFDPNGILDGKRGKLEKGKREKGNQKSKIKNQNKKKPESEKFT